MRQLSYKKVDEYFNDIAVKNVDIKDYCGTSVNELANKIGQHNGILYTILILFNIQNKFTGNQLRTLNNRTISFTIAFAGVDANDYPAQVKAVDDAETIGLQVLSRINIDSKGKKVDWLYNNFDPNTVHFMEFEAETVEGLFGCEFHFDLKNPEPLLVDPAKWSDGDEYCTG
jgi:hypothetical protein